MPAGSHAVLDQTRQAIEERARRLLTQLHELEDDPTIKAIDEETGYIEEVPVTPARSLAP
jgi:hypothetical protein